MGGWGLDSWVRECLAPLGDRGRGGPPGWKDCTFRPGHVRVGSRPGPAPSPTPQSSPPPRRGSHRPGSRRRAARAEAAAIVAATAAAAAGPGGGPDREWRGLCAPCLGSHALTSPALPPSPAPAVTGAPSATATSSRRPLAAPAPPAPPHAGPAFLARTIACPLCAGRSSSRTPRGSLRQAPTP